MAQAYLCDLGVSVLRCLGRTALQTEFWPSGQAEVPMAMPYPWTVSWAPQATGMSQKYHPSGKHPNCLSQTATLNWSNRKILSERVLIFSSENRWPPLQSSPSALCFPFPPLSLYNLRQILSSDPSIPVSPQPSEPVLFLSPGSHPPTDLGTDQCLCFGLFFFIHLHICKPISMYGGQRTTCGSQGIQLRLFSCQKAA